MQHDSENPRESSDNDNLRAAMTKLENDCPGIKEVARRMNAEIEQDIRILDNSDEKIVPAVIKYHCDGTEFSPEELCRYYNSSCCTKIMLRLFGCCCKKQ